MFDQPLSKELVDFRLLSDDHGRKKGRKRGRRTFTITDEAYEGLKYLAKKHGTNFGQNISVSELIEQIGNFELKVVEPGAEAKKAIIAKLREKYGE